MKVFKFGGASLKNSSAVRNTATIIKSFENENILIVVSAMGKTTNALEKVLSNYYAHENYTEELDRLRDYHISIMNDLFEKGHPVFGRVEEIFYGVESTINRNEDYDCTYDQIVSNGELISSTIIYHFLLQQKLSVQWIDAREYIRTDDTFREGKVQWEETAQRIDALRSKLHNSIILTQGFIGKTTDGFTTTLGREGSDFSAAIFASCLQAESVTIWKDVPGVMNSDPKRIPTAVVFNELPFREAAEMTYYGACVIHPKTIKPLANKGIPLFVKNFDDASLPGTLIHECTIDHLPPLIVFKDNQCLVSCKVTDYTFINEQQLSILFQILSELNVKINVMQNSAISFSFCIDFNDIKVPELVKKLQHHFEVYYNTGLTLITIKNYDQETFDKYRKSANVLLEQSSRSTLQILIKE